MTFVSFTSKPIIIKAQQWDGTVQQATEIIDYILAHEGAARYVDYDPNSDTHIDIDTLEGTMSLYAGSWAIEGTEGEFYPCKNSVFKRKYDLTNPINT